MAVIIVCLLIQLYMVVIFVRIIMSWFPPTPGTTYAQIFDVFDRLTEPVLAPIRAVLPPVRMGWRRSTCRPSWSSCWARCCSGPSADQGVHRPVPMRGGFVTLRAWN